MTSVIQKIEKWAEELPYWEQVALDKILQRKEFAEEDYAELLQILLEEGQLVQKASPWKAISFQKDAYASLDACKPVVLKEISKLNNVNALVPGQRLTFSPQLTAIFGRNGSGKSGYARVLGCAGFTRGDKVILPDITRPGGLPRSLLMTGND